MARHQTGSAKGIFHEHYTQLSKRLKDPYAEYQGGVEPAVCPTCKLIYQKKRWHRDDPQAKLLLKDKGAKRHLCPACHKIKDNYPLGIVNIRGDFLAEHFEDVVHLIKSEERRAEQKNPLERLMKIDKVNGGLHVETTSETLAMRLGHVLQRAFKGDTDFKFKSGNKYVEVDWSRGS
ncbi:MAG: BCAM0308 family protein [Candidatus Margulisiibacteriota bacterium]